MTTYSRRNFLKTAAIGAAGLTIVPNTILGKTRGYTVPSDKLNIAGIGVGGMGRRNLANMKTDNIVALCDVDWKYASKTFNDYPKAKQFKDWRVMGVLAVRLSGLQGLHRELQWDGENMQFTNISSTDKIRIVTLDEYAVIDGDPKFDRRFAEFNTLEMANEWIKHTYENGFTLPDMPK